MVEPKMEFNKNTEIQCFRIGRNILGNLNITYSDDTTYFKIVLWSKYKVYMFNPILDKTIDFKVQFKIEQVLVNGDCLLCLDYDGLINLCTIESTLIIDKQNIKCVCACEIINVLHVISLQLQQNDCKLLINKFDMRFESQNEIQVGIPNENWKDPEGGKTIITASQVKADHLKKLNETFDIKNTNSTYILVVVSLDRRNVYAVLIPVIPKRDVNMPILGLPRLKDELQNTWVKLHSSSTEIVDIKITMLGDICVILGLAAGTIIKIPLLSRNKKPEVFHLNTAINNFALIGDNIIIYSDGLTMWKSDNICSQSDCKFKQFLVRNVRDFCLIKKKLYCLTYSNLIYSFDINHTTAYVSPPNADNCDIVLVTDSEYLQKTINVVEENKQLIEKINKETEYLMILSLSNRQDIMDELIQLNISVFDDYRDLTRKHNDLTLADELKAYYDSQSYYFLIQISVANIQHKLNKLLSDILGDIKLHITLREQELLKTTSIQIKEKLTKQNIVISLKKENRNIRRVQIYVKIITNIPGVFDRNERLWVTLYRKKIVLCSENFINMKPSTNSVLLKQDKMPLEMLICKMTNHLHDTHYIYNISSNNRFEWEFYVKLPSDGNLCMPKILKLVNKFDSKRTEAFQKYITRLSTDWLELEIGQERVSLNIENDKLKVTCPDIIIASDIRNYFSSAIFANFKNKPALVDTDLNLIIEEWKNGFEINISSNGPEFARCVIEFLRTIYYNIPI